MVVHIYSDGRLGCIQPIGAAPGAFGPTSSYVYGVGGFLMAGAEMNRYVAHARPRAKQVLGGSGSPGQK